MATEIQELEDKALKLPPGARALLAEHLIASLDAGHDLESERRWVEEAERRYQAYKSGKVSARLAEDAFRDAYGRLQ